MEEEGKYVWVCQYVCAQKKNRLGDQNKTKQKLYNSCGPLMQLLFPHHVFIFHLYGCVCVCLAPELRVKKKKKR